MTDWEQIERLYRAGVPAVRAIAREHGVLESTIRARAKKYGWTRGDPAEVEREVVARLPEELRTAQVAAHLDVRIAQTAQPVLTREECIDAAASLVVRRIEEHREFGRAGLQTLAAMHRKLAQVHEHEDDIADAIVAEPGSNERKAAMLAAVNLGAQIRSMGELARAGKELIAIERRSYGLDDAAAPQTTNNVALLLDPEATQTLTARLNAILGHTSGRD